MTLKRFTVREEYFGSLVYDREKKDYIPFDAEATAVFRETSAGMPLAEVYSSFCKKNSEQSFQTFVKLCQSIELLNDEGVFDGDFINTGGGSLSVLSAPLRVHLQITNACPLKCRHCGQASREPYENELSFDEICSLIDEMAAIGVLEICIGGGEPFSRGDFINIVSYAAKKGIAVSLSASGLFVSRAAAKKLSEIGLKQIRISFDGASEKSYDYYRGKGTYRRAVRGIKTLRELFDCPLILHSVIMKPNIGELLSLFRAVQKFEADVWSLDFFRRSGGASSLTNFSLTPADASLVLRTVRRFAETSSVKIKIPSFPERASKINLYRGFGCSGGRMYCYINAKGDVKTCGFMPDSQIAGNIRRASLKDIWLYGEPFKELRELQGNDICNNCPSYNSCRGGCRARSFESHDLNGQDPLCHLIEEDKSFLVN